MQKIVYLICINIAALDRVCPFYIKMRDQSAKGAALLLNPDHFLCRKQSLSATHNTIFTEGQKYQKKISERKWRKILFSRDA